jgi:CheY-like chemotaxis protein
MRDQAVILLVDDSEADAYLIHRAFNNAAILSRLEIVMNDREAIFYLSGSGQYSNRTEYPLPDLLLLDLKASDADRSQLLRWIRDHPDLESTKVVALTSSNSPSAIYHSYTIGLNSFVVKPSDFQGLTELVNALHDWLSKTRPTTGTLKAA